MVVGFFGLTASPKMPSIIVPIRCFGKIDYYSGLPPFRHLIKRHFGFNIQVFFCPKFLQVFSMLILPDLTTPDFTAKPDLRSLFSSP